MAKLFPIPTRTVIATSDGTLSAEFTRWLSETLGRLNNPFANLPVYADNAAAVAGGLKKGEAYRSGDAVFVVHE